ncbi:MAG: hypothetical protein AAB971_01590 [Patescibacteria group bacterium]
MTEFGEQVPIEEARINQVTGLSMRIMEFATRFGNSGVTIMEPGFAGGIFD